MLITNEVTEITCLLFLFAKLPEQLILQPVRSCLSVCLWVCLTVCPCVSMLTMISQAAQSRCTVVSPMQKSNSTPCKIVTPKNCILKLCTDDYVGEFTSHANFRFNRYSGASPQIGEILPPFNFFWLSCPVLIFFSRSYAQVEPLDRFSRFMAQWRVSAQGWSFWALERWVTIFGENMPPKTPQKWAWIGNFQPKRQNIKIAISPKL